MGCPRISVEKRGGEEKQKGLHCPKNEAITIHQGNNCLYLIDGAIVALAK